MVLHFHFRLTVVTDLYPLVYERAIEIAHNPPNNADYAAFRGADACADFEGLLLHGRALLDRLASLLAGQFGQQCSSFRRIQNVLAAFPNRTLAQHLLTIVGPACDRIDAIYAKIDSPDSLRDMVGHRQALTELMRVCFGIWWFQPGKALLLDCEVQMTDAADPIPLFETSAQSAQSLAFAALDSASVLLGLEPLGSSAYTPTWLPATVVLTRHILTDGAPLGSNTIRFAKTMTPAGFTIELGNVDPAVRVNAIAIDPSAA